MSVAARRQLVSVALVAAVLGCMPALDQPLAVGAPIPHFDLAKLGGGRLSSDELRGGGPVVINFWATWCGPCVHEIPALQELHRQQGARVISIALDRGGAGEVAPFVEQHGIDYPVLLGDMGLFSRYGGVAIPYTLVTDDQLRLQNRNKGLISLATLERQIAQARDSGSTKPTNASGE